jgi:hypothetical protein
MTSHCAHDGLIDLLEDLEFFLEMAEQSIEERDKIIQELVARLEAMAAAANRENQEAEIYACRATIAKARALVPH